MSLATKFMVVTAKGPKEAAQHAIFGAVSKPTGKGKPKEPEEKTGDPPTCAYCMKTGHRIEACFKLLASQAKYQQDHLLKAPKKATAAATTGTPARISCIISNQFESNNFYYLIISF